MVTGAVSVIVALFSGWLTAIHVVIYFVVAHVIERDVIGPRSEPGDPPRHAIVALVAGSELVGIWGAFFGAPLGGPLQAIVVVMSRNGMNAPPGETFR
jgi:predicted PurR-regulated permease PerM